MGPNDTGIFNDIVLGTLNARLKDIETDTLNRECMTLAMLQKNAIYEEGDAISVKFRKDKLPVGTYEYDQQRPVESPPLFVGGSIRWKTTDVTVSVNEQDMIENSGLNIQQILNMKSINKIPSGHLNTLFSLFQEYHTAALIDIQEGQAEQIFGDGYDKETGYYTAIEGFPVIFNKGGSYAGLDPNDERIGKFSRTSVVSGTNDNIWDPREMDLENKRAGTSLDITNIATDARQGRKGDIWLAMSPEHYNAMEYAYEGDKTRSNAEAIKLGFKKHMYVPRLDVTLYSEDFLTGSNDWYGWMPRHMKLVKNASLSMAFSGVMVQIDKNRIVYRYKDMCNLRCSSRANQFVIRNVRVE